MLTYVAAVATATSLAVGSIPMLQPGVQIDAFQMAVPGAVETRGSEVRINQSFSGAAFLDAVPPYALSAREQKVLKRALFKSVRFVDGLA